MYENVWASTRYLHAARLSFFPCIGLDSKNNRRPKIRLWMLVKKKNKKINKKTHSTRRICDESEKQKEHVGKYQKFGADVCPHLPKVERLNYCNTNSGNKHSCVFLRRVTNGPASLQEALHIRGKRTNFFPFPVISKFVLLPPLTYFKNSSNTIEDSAALDESK